MCALNSLRNRTRWLLSLGWESKRNKASYQSLIEHTSPVAFVLHTHTNKRLLKTKRVDDEYSGTPFILTGAPHVMLWTDMFIDVFTRASDTSHAEGIPHSVNPRHSVEFHFERELYFYIYFHKPCLVNLMHTTYSNVISENVIWKSGILDHRKRMIMKCYIYR